ncbi:MAG: hypothetical protein JNJ45_10425 [Chthonomonas sp.]|nr:hypothetical protein [Chthonomonas sp.]
MTKVRIGSLALVSMLAVTTAFAQVKVSLNVKEGDKIGVEKMVEVDLQSKEDITQVEFYVNNELRNTDDSTPYEFLIDGLTQPEGKLTLKVQAYTATGKSGTVSVTLNVDNGLAAGPAPFVAAGEDLFRNGKFSEAITQGRLALKAQKDYNPGRLLLAKSNLQLGIFDRAVKFAEEILISEPKNLAALDLASAASLQQAFNYSNRSSNRDEILNVLGGAFKSAAKYRQKVYQARIDAFGEVKDDNLLDYADLLTRAGRYGAAADALMPTYMKDRTNTLIANRLFYAMVRGGRAQKAYELMTGAERRKELDGGGLMIMAILHDLYGKATPSMDAERAALLQDSTSATVTTGQAFFALAKNRTAAMRGVLTALGKNSQDPVNGAYMSQFQYRLNDFEGSRRSFESTLLAEPLMFDAFLSRAAQAVDFSFRSGTAEKDAEYQRRAARMYLQSALEAKPESFQALTSLAILAVTENKSEEAIGLARAATKAGPEYGGGFYTLGMVASLRAKLFGDREQDLLLKAKQAAGNGLAEDAKKFAADAALAGAESRKLAAESDEAMRTAGKFDPANLAGRTVPQPLVAWTYVSTQGRIPLLAMTR